MQLGKTLLDAYYWGLLLNTEDGGSMSLRSVRRLHDVISLKTAGYSLAISKVNAEPYLALHAVQCQNLIQGRGVETIKTLLLCPNMEQDG
jgi:hypothetical protein